MTSFTQKELTGIGVTLIVVAVLFLGAKLYQESASERQSADDANEVVTLSGGEDADIGGIISGMLEGVSQSGRVTNLLILDIDEGEGPEVVSGDTVSVHYIGMLRDGTEFDNSYTRGEPFTFTVGMGDVIEGWDQGLLGMKVGGTRILVIPSDMAYRERGSSVIPPNSELLFAVELLKSN